MFRKKAGYIIVLISMICSCTKYGHLHIIEGEAEEAKVVELDIEHNWGDPTSGRATYGRALYSENVRLVAEHPFGSAEMEPISRFYESIELSEGDDVLIIIEYDKRLSGVQVLDLHLYISVPEIVIGKSIRIGPDGNYFSIGYDSAKGLRYDIGEGYIEFVSSGDDGLEIVIDIKYMAFEPYGPKTPDSHKSKDPLTVRIKGMVKARKDSSLRRLIGMRTSVLSIVHASIGSGHSAHGKLSRNVVSQSASSCVTAMPYFLQKLSKCSTFSLCE
jgi:hypothetical protein